MTAQAAMDVLDQVPLSTIPSIEGPTVHIPRKVTATDPEVALECNRIAPKHLSRANVLQGRVLARADLSSAGPQSVEIFVIVDTGCNTLGLIHPRLATQLGLSEIDLPSLTARTAQGVITMVRGARLYIYVHDSRGWDEVYL